MARSSYFIHWLLMAAAWPVVAQIPNTLLHALPGPPSTVLQAGARLGSSVAVDGNLIVMGAPYDNTGGSPPTNIACGVAKVFDATTGALLHVLVNPEPQNSGNFGVGVAVSGTRICIGAPGNGTSGPFPAAGKVYVYDLASNTPTLPVRTFSGSGSNSDFGRVVAMSGTLIYVGLPGDPGSLGVVAIFDLDLPGGLFGLLDSEFFFVRPSGGDMFGSALATSGSRVVVGNYWATSDSPAVAYVLDSSTGQKFSLALSAGALDFVSCRSVAIDGTRVVVGAVSVNGGITDAGGVYVFDLSSAVPGPSLILPVLTLDNPVPTDGDQFGYAVAVSGTRVMAGKHLSDTGAANAGSLYVYDMAGGTPTVPVAVLDNPGPAAEENFGFAVAAVGTRVVACAPGESSVTSLAGGGYVYDFSGVTPTAPALTLSDPGTLPGGLAGRSVALSGSRFVVGAHGDDEGATDAGSARVYDLSSGDPTVPVLTLTHPVPTTSANFGRSVAMEGARLVVGAPGSTGGGVVFVYDLDHATPATPLLTIANPSPASGDGFGYVALSGSLLVVGAPADDTLASNAGSVYVFDLAGLDPTVPVMTLNKPGAVASDSFGTEVAMDGMLVVVSAPGDDTGASNAGSAFVFDLAGATPTAPVATLNNPTPASQDGFGSAVAIFGLRVVIGASGDDTGASNAGSVYVYDLGGDTPLVPLTLNNPEPVPFFSSDGFGSALTMEGTRLVTAAASDDLAAVNVGTVYVYELAGANPEVPAFKLDNPIPFAGDLFGSALALEGGTLIVGAFGKDTPAHNAGAAYVFGPHPLDQDSDGMRDAWELTWWPGASGHGPLDDDDHDGIVNLLEMAFGLNPTLPDGGTLVPAVAEDGFLTMTITKQAGVIYEVQSAGTLLPALPDAFSASTTTVLVDDATTLKVRDNSPVATTPTRFMRVQVNGAP